MCVEPSTILRPVATNAVTVHCTDINFLVGAQVGDLILLKSEIDQVGSKSISVRVEGYRERADGIEKLCDGRFVFVSKKEGKTHPHGLELGA